MIQRVFILLLSVFAVSAFAVDTYKIDPAHTAIIFKVSHLGFSNTYGMFPDVDGSFVLDEAKPEKSSVELKIKVDALSTHNEKRDQHLKGPDFFGTKTNKLITFKSTSIKPDGKNKFKMTGDMTLNGITKPVTFDMTRNRTGQDPWGGTRTGFDGTAKLKRSDFKMNFMSGENAIGDDVDVIISAEGIKNK